MNLRCPLLLTGVWSGLKLRCVVSTWCADAQMSPSGERSVLCCGGFFFFQVLSIPLCSLGLFAKHCGSLVPFSFVSVQCCAFDLCCAHYHERCLFCLKTKVTSGGTNLGSHRPHELLLSWLFHPKHPGDILKDILHILMLAMFSPPTIPFTWRLVAGVDQMQMSCRMFSSHNLCSDGTSAVWTRTWDLFLSLVSCTLKPCAQMDFYDVCHQHY